VLKLRKTGQPHPGHDPARPLRKPHHHALPPARKPPIRPRPQSHRHAKSFRKTNIDYQTENTETGDILVVEIAYSLDTQRVELKDYPEFRKFVSDMTSALNESIGISQPVQ